MLYTRVYIVDLSTQMAIDLQPLRTARKFVAAIDFGTTYSGWAFSHKSDWAKVTVPKWAGHMMSFKTPTAVLLHPDKSFDSFGYDAETRYCELVEEKKDTDYFYFHRFKMPLAKENTEKVIICLYIISVGTTIIYN